jgi:hypothetical protein
VIHRPSNSLINSPLGSARSIYVYTSSPGFIVEFVITGELSADKTIVYGFVPPSIVRPHGSHVVKLSVKFGCTEATEFGGVYRQEVLLPAGLMYQNSPSGRIDGQHSPVTLNSVGETPPVLPFESIIDSMRVEPTTK